MVNIDYYPEVIQVIPYSDFSVDVYFHDGKIVCFSMKDLISEGVKKGNVFKKLANLSFFLKKCTVMNGTLAWDLSGNRDESDCIDIDPLTLYELPMAKERISVFDEKDDSSIVAEGTK